MHASRSPWFRRLCVTSTLAASTLAPPARAHSGIPRAIGIHSDPTDPSHLVVESDAWGLFESRDGGATFWWVCAEAYEGDSLGILHPSAVITQRGTTLIANFYAGLQASTPDSCGWAPVPALDTSVAQDIVQTETGDLVVLAANGAMTRLLRSSDGGESWQEFGEPLPTDAAAISLATRSLEGVLFVGSLVPETGQIRILRSDDGAETWMARDTELEVRAGRPLVFTDPSSSERLYLRIDNLPTSQQAPDPPDALWMSADSGESWQLLLQATADLPGLAFSPNGKELAVAGPAEGLRIARLGELGDAGSAAFEPRFGGPLWALAWREDGLLADQGDLNAGAAGFKLARSTDDGWTFEPVFSVCETELIQCSESPSAQTRCADTFSRLNGFEQAILLSKECVAERPDGGAAQRPDAGESAAPVAGTSGCGCTVPRRRGGTGPLMTFLGAALLAAARSRVRRTPRPAPVRRH